MGLDEVVVEDTALALAKVAALDLAEVAILDLAGVAEEATSVELAENIRFMPRLRFGIALLSPKP